MVIQKKIKVLVVDDSVVFWEVIVRRIILSNDKYYKTRNMREYERRFELINKNNAL